jgi:Zn-dependent protease
MLYLLAALALCLATGKILQGGWRGQHGFQIAKVDFSAGAFAALVVGAAVYFWGVVFGLALVVALLLHEFGHYAAYRLCGHADARFRLIPLAGRTEISTTAPASADKAFFIALMGPAINLGPMMLCFALTEVIFSTEFASELPYQFGGYIYVQGMVFAALSFFNLLPLWPLDGAKLTQRLIFTFAPDLTRQTSIAMTVLALALCLLTRSYFLVFFVLLGWPGLTQSETLLRAQRPLSTKRAFLALAAYLTTAAAFFLGGHPLLMGFF